MFCIGKWTMKDITVDTQATHSIQICNSGVNGGGIQFQFKSKLFLDS